MFNEYILDLIKLLWKQSIITEINLSCSDLNLMYVLVVFINILDLEYMYNLYMWDSSILLNLYVDIYFIFLLYTINI